MTCKKIQNIHSAKQIEQFHSKIHFQELENWTHVSLTFQCISAMFINQYFFYPKQIIVFPVCKSNQPKWRWILNRQTITTFWCDIALLHEKRKHKSPHWNRKNIFGCNLHCRIRFFARIDFTLFVFIHSIRNFENLHLFAGLFHCSNAHTIHAWYALGTCQAIIIYFVGNENSWFFPGKLISNSFFYSRIARISCCTLSPLQL